MSKEYKIKEIKDILQIPTDRLEVFFEEFKQIVYDTKDICGDINNFVGLLSDDKEFFSEVFPEVLTWIDDGKKNKTIVLNAVENKNPPQEESEG